MSAAKPPEPETRDEDTVAELHARAQQDANPHQRKVEVLSAALGRPRTIYVLLGLVLTWTGSNLLCMACGVRPFDAPPFFWLQGVIGLFALLLTAIVIITQNRQAKLSERRALLDLHVNLLVERKVAKLISLIEELRRDLPQVHDRRDDQAEAMTHPLDPHQTVVNLEQSIERRIESAQLAERSPGAGDDEGGEDAPAPPVTPPQAR